MKFRTIKLLAVTTALALTTPALAVPNTPAEMRQIIATQFAGNANAYVEEEDGDFRRMGCRGRVDLVQALLDEGLLLEELSFRTHWRAAACAWNENEMEAVELLLTPDLLTAFEESRFGETWEATLLWNRIYADDYEKVLFLLENGVHTFENDADAGALSREEHLLLAAESAIDNEKEDAIRAFEEAGFGYLLDAARNEENYQYVRQRMGRGGGGGDLFGAIARAVGGAYMGGGVGAGAGLLMGTTGGDSGGDELVNSGPLPLPTSRADLGLAFSSSRVPHRGLVIQQLLPDGAGGIAGLREGDVIVSIAGIPVASRGSYYVATESAFGLQEFEVEYLRGGQRSTAVIGRPPPEPEAPPSAAAGAAAQVGYSVSGSNSRSVIEELQALGDLRDRGILSDEEFEDMKARILGAPAISAPPDQTAPQSNSGTRSSVASEAFGIRMGQPISDMSVINEYPNGRYEVVSPVLVADLNSLVVRATPDTGICAVEMFGTTYENDRRGQVVLAAYNRHRQELDSLFGLPEETDVLRENSEANAPNDYAQSIWLRHRVKSSVWQIDEPQGIQAVYLDVFADGPYDLYVKLSYTFANFERCQSIIDARSS